LASVFAELNELKKLILVKTNSSQIGNIQDEVDALQNETDTLQNSDTINTSSSLSSELLNQINEVRKLILVKTNSGAIGAIQDEVNSAKRMQYINATTSLIAELLKKNDELLKLVLTKINSSQIGNIQDQIDKAFQDIETGDTIDLFPARSFSSVVGQLIGQIEELRVQVLALRKYQKDAYDQLQVNKEYRKHFMLMGS
jgi:hypothetical protein